MLKILLAEKSSFSKEGVEALSRIGHLDAEDLTQTSLTERIAEYDVLVLRLGLRVDANVLSCAAKLKAIVTPTTGLDHIDVIAAQNQGVQVFSLKGERDFLDSVYSTAEHTFGLMLSLLRKIPAAFNAVKRYEWRRDIFRGRELDGKKIGLVGCGRLGTMMARYCSAFGMRVLVFDPYQKNLPEWVHVCPSLDYLLAESDIISLHVPLNDETRGMISYPEFAKMKKGAYLVNTSRGAVIDETALLDALRRGILSGAALDVLIDEHRIEVEKSNPVIEYAKHHDNLIITPHIGGAAVEAVVKADLFVIEKLRKWMEYRDE